MPRQFDTELNRLKTKLLTMGATAEKMIHDVSQALADWNLDFFKSVEKAEESMDLLQRDIDEETIRLIAVYTPVAVDLRFLLMVTRINTDLERIGDQAINIAFYARQMMKDKPLKPLIDLPRMAELAKGMLRKSLDAFTQRSSDLAREVIRTDDKVDQLNDQIFRELMTFVLTDPKTIPQALELILTARAFERIADHAVAIAEDVYYLVKGKDIRHLS
jgi:phosphate transport system protein